MNINKKRLWQIVNPDTTGDKIGKFFDIFILTLIFISTIDIILSSFDFMNPLITKIFDVVEIFTLSVFTIEYALKLWLCTQESKYKNQITGRLLYIISPQAIIDLIAIAPFIIPLFYLDLRFVRIVKFFRLLRILKIERYLSALFIIKNMLKTKKEELLIYCGIFSIILILSSIAMFYVENSVQPKVFASVPHTIWWSISALTTLDSNIYPISSSGKFVAAITSFLGLGLIALLTSILSHGFSDVINKNKDIKKCPHCGKNLE